jgi:hypothetical protein
MSNDNMREAYFSLRSQALRAESQGDWSEAVYLWRKAGEEQQAQTCQHIRDAVARGDRFRSLVKSRLEEAGLPEEMPACVAFDKILRECHNEVYS